MPDSMMKRFTVLLSGRPAADDRFQQLFDAAPDAQVVVDGKGRIILVNTQVEKLFGYQREELLGRQMEMLVPERFRRQHPGHRDAFFGQPRARPMGSGVEIYGLRKDGSEFAAEISLSPIKTTEGTLVSSAI